MFLPHYQTCAKLAPETWFFFPGFFFALAAAAIPPFVVLYLSVDTDYSPPWGLIFRRRWVRSCSTLVSIVSLTPSREDFWEQGDEVVNVGA